MDRKQDISFKHINYMSFLVFLTLILSPVISIALSSEITEQSFSPLEASSQQTPQNLTTYGPVENNVGLWEIAEKLHTNLQVSTLQNSDSEITIPQIAVALFDENPEAFIKQNINGLLVGSTLKVPDIQHIQKLTRANAFDLFLHHWDVWQGVKSEIVIRKNNNNNNLVKQKGEAEKITLQTSNKLTQTIETEARVETLKQTKSVVSIIPSIAPVALEYTPINHQVAQQKTDNIDISLVDQMKNINVHQNILGVINWFQSNLNLSNINKINILELFNNTSVKIALISLFFIIFLAWLSRREEPEIIEIRTSQSPEKETSLSEEKTILDESLISQDHASKDENTPLLEFKQSILLEKKDSFEEIDVYSGNIIPNQIDLDATIVQDEKKIKHSSKNMLETAFANNIVSSSNQFVSKEIQVEQKTQTQAIETQSPEEFLFDSIDEIRFVNEETKSSKFNAFLDATQPTTLSDELLSRDFDIIINSDKIDIFIKEFEEVMSELSNHAPEVSQTPNDLDNLLQFKSSIHFIKILSEMMQATYLKQFSTTIIEFLEDVLDGKTKMTTDTTNRLILVISFYSRYIHSIKKQNNGKLEA